MSNLFIWVGLAIVAFWVLTYPIDVARWIKRRRRDR